jgi:GDP-4-dehydro-6-deoxy-D-mannose reductase
MMVNRFVGGYSRILITGGHGFVGPYVTRALRRVCGEKTQILVTGGKNDHSTVREGEVLDVTDKPAVRRVIGRYNPSHVVHLAGLAAPAAAAAEPDRAWNVHVHGTLNIAHAILDEVPDCWLIHVGSGLVYGGSAKSGLALDETAVLAPIDEYGATKAAADLALGALSYRGLKVVRMRPFNHIGVGQSDAFVVSAFATQVARIEVGLVPAVIQVGNLDSERDFLDVRDIAKAYALAVLGTAHLPHDVIFNIASGVPRRIGDILRWFLEQSRVSIAVERDRNRLRPSDLPRIVGDSSRIRKALDWEPEYGLWETLTEILDDCRRRVGTEGHTQLER